MISSSYRSNPYPSSGTRQHWHSTSLKSSYNRNNIEDETIDFLMDEILNYQEEKDQERLLALGKAIDRELLHNYDIVPLWNISKFRIAHWDKFGKPEKTPRYAQGDGAWWFDPDKALNK